MLRVAICYPFMQQRTQFATELMKSEMSLAPAILSSIERALVEDIGRGDATTTSIVHAEATIEGQIIAKASGVVAGLSVARATLRLLDKRVGLGDRSRVRLLVFYNI